MLPRYCSKVDYDLKYEVRVCCGFIPLNLQLLVMYLGFLLMIVSRIALVALVYVVCRETQTRISLWEDGPNLITPLCVELHHLTVFTVYLVNQRVQEKKKSIVIIEKLKRWNMVISFLLFSFSEVFLILLQFPQRYRRAIRSLTKEKDKGDERFKSFYLFYGLNLIEFAVMIYVCDRNTDNLREDAFFTGTSIMSVMYGSIAFFLLSGVFFCLYHSPLLHPDSLKQRVEYKGRVSWWMFGQHPQCGVAMETDRVGDMAVTLNKGYIKLDQVVEEQVDHGDIDAAAVSVHIIHGEVEDLIPVSKGDIGNYDDRLLKDLGHQVDKDDENTDHVEISHHIGNEEGIGDQNAISSDFIELNH